MACLKFTLLLFLGLHGNGLASRTDEPKNLPDRAAVDGDACRDCAQILKVLVDLLSNAEVEKRIIGGIERVCEHLPGPAETAAVCREELEKILPVVFKLLIGFVNPAQACRLAGFCERRTLSYLVGRDAVADENVAPATQCSFCELLVKTLEDLLPKESTEEALMKLLEETCHLLPSSYRLQCQLLIGKFTKTVLEAILSYATPKAVCALLHLCEGPEGRLADPCILPWYRCRDATTAARCGTVFYCQRFTWKPLGHDSF